MTISVINNTGTALNYICGITKPRTVEEKKIVTNGAKLTCSLDTKTNIVYVLLWSTELKRYHVATLKQDESLDLDLAKMTGYNKMQLNYGPLNVFLE